MKLCGNNFIFQRKKISCLANFVNKAFIRHFGVSCPRYILRLKMDEAQRLIQRGGLASKEIAARLGFSSPQYFCGAYRAYFGHPPFAR